MAEFVAFQNGGATCAPVRRLLARWVAEVAVGPRPVALMRDALRHVEHDRHRQAVKLAREPAPSRRLSRASGWRPSVASTTVSLPAANRLRAMKCSTSKGVRRRRLAVFVIGHQRAAEVGRQNLRRLEVFSCEGALARAGHADVYATERGKGRRRGSFMAVATGIGSWQLECRFVPIPQASPAWSARAPIPSLRKRTGKRHHRLGSFCDQNPIRRTSAS